MFVLGFYFFLGRVIRIEIIACQLQDSVLVCRKGVPQPDNEEGIREGPIKVDNNIGKAGLSVDCQKTLMLTVSSPSESSVVDCQLAARKLCC